MSLRGFSSENRGRTFSKDQSQRHDTSAPAFATLVRPSHAQAPDVLDHSRTLPQGDGGAGPAFAGGAEGSERDLIVLDASDVLHDAFAVRGPRIDAEGEVRSKRRGHLRPLLLHSSSAAGAWVKHSPAKRLRNASAVAVSGK